MIFFSTAVFWDVMFTPITLILIMLKNVGMLSNLGKIQQGLKGCLLN